MQKSRAAIHKKHLASACAAHRYPVTLRTIGQFWTVSFSLRTKVSQTLQSVLCITTNKYLVCVLVVLLHACFSVVSPIPFLLAAIFFPGHPYIGSTTVLPNNNSNNNNDEEFFRTIGQFWTVSFSLWTKVSQTLQSVLCITTNKYLVHVLVVVLHDCFSVVSPIPFLLAAIFFPGYPYIGSTTVLPNYVDYNCMYMIPFD